MSHRGVDLTRPPGIGTATDTRPRPRLKEGAGRFYRFPRFFHLPSCCARPARLRGFAGRVWERQAEREMLTRFRCWSRLSDDYPADDPDLRQRFEREAKTIFSLNHPLRLRRRP